MNNSITCFVCGHKTLEERCDWEICPVCFWEDDLLVTDENDGSSPANRGMAVSEAQANFILFGACSKDVLIHCRPPNENEELDPDWKPLKEAIRIAQSKRDQSTNELKAHIHPNLWVCPQWHPDWGNPKIEFEMLKNFASKLIAVERQFTVDLNCFEEGYLEVQIFHTGQLIAEVQIAAKKPHSGDRRFLLTAENLGIAEDYFESSGELISKLRSMNIANQ